MSINVILSAETIETISETVVQKFLSNFETRLPAIVEQAIDNYLEKRNTHSITSTVVADADADTDEIPKMLANAKKEAMLQEFQICSRPRKFDLEVYIKNTNIQEQIEKLEWNDIVIIQ